MKPPLSVGTNPAHRCGSGSSNGPTPLFLTCNGASGRTLGIQSPSPPFPKPAANRPVSPCPKTRGSHRSQASRVLLEDGRDQTTSQDDQINTPRCHPAGHLNGRFTRATDSVEGPPQPNKVNWPIQLQAGPRTKQHAWTISPRWSGLPIVVA